MTQLMNIIREVKKLAILKYQMRSQNVEKNYILKSLNDIKVEILNLKEVVIKNLQNENK